MLTIAVMFIDGNRILPPSLANRFANRFVFVLSNSRFKALLNGQRPALPNRVFWDSARLTPLVFIIATLLFPGCSPSVDQTVEPPPARPLRMMESALRRGQLQEAWQYVSDVIEQHGDDPAVLSQVARLAHEVAEPEEAAKYLVRACEAETYSNPQRVQQAMIALVGVGKLYEGLDFLEATVTQHPDQHESRRWLFDLLMGSEDRQAGLPHGRYLIRARQFDVELLKALSNTEYRTMDAQPLLQMTERYPDDTRPLLGDARQKFDERDYTEAIRVLDSITDKFPNFAPAQSLLGRAYAGSGDWKNFETWAEQVPETVSNYPNYWLALGDWARSNEKYSEAARCYWEATQVDPDVLEAWTKLSLSLRRMNLDPANSEPNRSTESKPMNVVSNAILDRIDQRASLLSGFNQQKQKFERTGEVSRETASEMAKSLQELGRLWEAEAWSSIAIQLPEDDSVPAEAVRNEIVSQLTKETPWQITSSFPELLMDLTSLNPPSLNRVTPNRISGEQESIAGTSNKPSIDLRNEASKRGLNFFGRTSDQLDQPGIMLYQTLGCGGGTIDYDLDGWSDLYLAAAEGTPPAKDSLPNAMFRNENGHFRDHASNAQLDDRGFAQGIAVGDVNEDGFPDILVLNYGPNTLFINNGDGSFSDATLKLVANPPQWSTSGAMADLDGDGLSDLVIVNYCDGLDPVHVNCPMPNSDISRSCSPVKFKAATDCFYQATTDGQLIDQTNQWKGQPSIAGRGLGIVIGSLDHQAGNDVLIANDMTNNHLWSLRQVVASNSDTKTETIAEAKPEPAIANHQLVESAMLRGLGADDRSLAQGSMGIASGDLNRDGDIDFYITNFDKEYNTLHDNRSAGIWQDITSGVNLAAPTMPLVGFGTEAIDLNSDGELELVIANGHVDMFSRGNEKSLYDHPMQIFERVGESNYQSIGDQMTGDYLKGTHVARALWTIDANGDQLSDMVVTHQTEPVALLVNHSSQMGSNIHFELIGTTSSRFAVGATLRVRSGEQVWTAWQLSGDGYLCSNERTIRFGLGKEISSCDVEVEWPSGLKQTIENLKTGATYLIVEADDGAFPLKSL